MTDGYRRGLAYIERQMAAQCDTVIECAAGGAIVHKGKLPAGFRFSNTGDTQMELIIGGACQGKKEYAISHFGLKDGEIFTCTEDGEPDLTVRCIDHLERYLRRCAAEDREPAAPDAFRKEYHMWNCSGQCFGPKVAGAHRTLPAEIGRRRS